MFIRSLLRAIADRHRTPSAAVVVSSENVSIENFKRLWPRRAIEQNADLFVSGTAREIVASHLRQTDKNANQRIVAVPLDLKSRSLESSSHLIELVVWLTNYAAIPIALGVISNCLTAKWLSASRRSKEDPVTIMLAITKGNNVKTVSITGPRKLIADKINTDEFFQALEADE
jgi:hypothetical protein